MNGRTTRDGTRRDGWAVESCWEEALEWGEYVTRNVVRGGEVNQFPIETEDGAVDRAAEPNSFRCDGLEYGLHIGRRARNHTQDLAGRLLLLLRFSQALLKIADPSAVLPRRAGSSGRGCALFGCWTPTHQPLLASDTESAGDRLGEGVHMGKGEVMAKSTVHLNPSVPPPLFPASTSSPFRDTSTSQQH